MTNAYPHTSQTIAQTVAGIQGVNSAVGTDACNNALYALANATNVALNTAVLIGGCLVICTTGFGTAASPTTPQFSWDGSTIA